MFKKFCDYFLHPIRHKGGQSVQCDTRGCQRKSRKLRIELVVCKCSYAAVARLDWYRRLTSGFSDVARKRPVSERHPWTEVGTKLLVHHFFCVPVTGSSWKLMTDRSVYLWEQLSLSASSRRQDRRRQHFAERGFLWCPIRQRKHSLTHSFSSVFIFFNGWFTCQFFWQLRKKCWNYCIRLFEIFW